MQDFLFNLHFNENAKRKQAETIDGQLRWSIVYPKANKGEKGVARPLKEKPTYGTLFNYIYVFTSFALKRSAIHHATVNFICRLYSKDFAGGSKAKF